MTHRVFFKFIYLFICSWRHLGIYVKSPDEGLNAKLSLALFRYHLWNAKLESAKSFRLQIRNRYQFLAKLKIKYFRHTVFKHEIYTKFVFDLIYCLSEVFIQITIWCRNDRLPNGQLRKVYCCQFKAGRHRKVFFLKFILHSV